jgi:hypothetical protein
MITYSAGAQKDFLAIHPHPPYNVTDANKTPTLKI